MWYRTGTVSVTQGSTAIVGAGTDWIDQREGWWVWIRGEANPHEIADIVSATELTLQEAVEMPTGAGLQYAIIPTQGLNIRVLEKIEELIALYKNAQVAWDALAAAPGDLLYNLWIAEGNTGTKAQYLATVTGPPGPAGARGADGLGVVIKGALATLADLPTPGTEGDAYVVAGNLQVWNEAAGAWQNGGALTSGGGAGTATVGSVADVPGLQALLDAKAPIASPVLTGNPTAPTAATADNSTSLATTAFVQAVLAGAGGGGGTTDYTALTNVPTTFAPSAHIHSIADITGLQLQLDSKQASAGAFSGAYGDLTGAPTLGTASAAALGDFATAAQGALAASAVQPAALTAATLSLAPLASPVLTGAPTAPTAVITSNDTTLATTEFVTRAAAAIAGFSGAYGDLTGAPTLGTAAAAATTDFATAAQGTLADNALPAAEKGAANGVASLDANGIVPTAQLPSYVDDVIEAADLASFPVTGETGKIYVAIDTGKIYRWSGATYIEISDTAGTADQATALATARDIALTGDVTGTASFDGSANIAIAATVVDNSHDHTIANVTGLQAELDLKAPLESPVFTGDPTAPTPATTDDDTSIATTAFVKAVVALPEVAFDAGTQATGALAVDGTESSIQYAVNAGSHTLTPPNVDGRVTIKYTNTAAAGPILIGGFAKVSGDSITLDDGDKYLMVITRIDGESFLDVQAA